MTETAQSPFELHPVHHVQLAIPRGVRAVAEALESAGYPVTWDADFPGHDRFYAADPFGNRLEFLEPTTAE